MSNHLAAMNGCYKVPPPFFKGKELPTTDTLQNLLFDYLFLPPTFFSSVSSLLLHPTRASSFPSPQCSIFDLLTQRLLPHANEVTIVESAFRRGVFLSS